jgi:hypothetical protein
VKNFIKRAASLLLCAALALNLSGCSLRSVDELYSLPQPSEEYISLQSLLDAELADGCEYSAPTGGNYRQSVHSVDLDGCGDAEALAFLRDADATPKICIYGIDGDEYYLACTITGTGSSIGGVEYSDLDGDGYQEIIVSWQEMTGFSTLCVYSMADMSGKVLLSTDNTAFRLADMTGSGTNDLLILHTGAEEGSSVEMFSFSGGSVTQHTAKLSGGVTSVDRLYTATLGDGVTALFAESPYGESSTVTDIFIATDTGLANITSDDQTGTNITAREYSVYATDVNNDGITEIPAAHQLEKYAEGYSAYWRFDWYSFSSNGERELVCSTYHCYSDGWYLILPVPLCDGLVVRREDSISGERVVILSTRDEDGTTTDLLTIYTLTGESRRDRAKLDGRFILSEVSTTIYAASLASGAPISQQDITNGFDIITTEWNSGAL